MAGVGGATAFADPGYIDPAIPLTRFRLRYDSAWNSNRPDRAEYFYARYKGGFNTIGGDPGTAATQQIIQQQGQNPIINTIPGTPGGAAQLVPFGNLDAPGQPLPETRVDYQDIIPYFELALNERFSMFAEVPVRFLNQEVNSDYKGLADMNAGFKYALLLDETFCATFQLRAYMPTGAASQGLGTHHFSIEPGLLLYANPMEGLFLFGEFKDWQAIGGTDFSGNVIRYGIGASYLLCNASCFRVAPVVECVGWTVLDGKESVGNSSSADGINSSGRTIVNAKCGVRIGFGDYDNPNPSALGRSDLYVGYGRALTGDVWYKDLLRVEFRIGY